ncbi:hypothetical protein [Ruegeria lacuscaerulensis]|uniref:hypothetical protein n=1 Tax=Ruegeria lacuscaerulensis TaxID=55218 RepID=UPI003AF92F68
MTRSCADLTETLDEFKIAARNRAWAKKGVTPMDALWNAADSQYLYFDSKADEVVSNPNVAGLIAAFASIPHERAEPIGYGSRSWVSPQNFWCPAGVLARLRRQTLLAWASVADCQLLDR